jgi:molybdenum-dependent DNA-binding transcriptional regulator ModE
MHRIVCDRPFVEVMRTEMAMNELNSRRLEIDALRALAAIRQHGGITRAAAALGLSQSAVSHKIKRLEISLDCELLCRKSTGPAFTAAGDDLLDYASRILGLHDEALLSLSKTPLAAACPRPHRRHGVYGPCPDSRAVSPSASECCGAHQGAHEPCPARHA